MKVRCGSKKKCQILNNHRTFIALRRPEGAAKGLNVDTVKRFSDFARRYILMEFSVAQNFGATLLYRHLCEFDA